MRKLTRKQILARLFVGFFTLGSLLCTVNSTVAEEFGQYKINNSVWSPFYSEIKPDGSGNSVEVEVTVSGSSEEPTPSISGGYTESGDISSNSVKITTNEGVATKLSSVYGGNVGGTGSATQNIVDIASSTVNGSVYSGFTYNGNVLENKVNIASSTINGENSYVYGGHVGGTGSATQNIVNIASSTVNNNKVYGGCVNDTGNASKNIVNITSGSEITGSVLGGYTQKGDVISNKVTIENNSKVTDNVYGVNGGFTNSGNATSNEVKIASSTINSDVYGGYTIDGGDSSFNKVEIIDGSIIKPGYYTSSGIIGGHAGAGDAISNTVSISNSSISTTNNFYNPIAGGEGVNSTENTVQIDNSTITGIPVAGGISSGGSDSFQDISSNTVNISVATISTDIAGGYCLANNGKVCSNTVEISDSSLLGEQTYNVWGGRVYAESGDKNFVSGNIVTITNSKKTSSGEIDGGSIYDINDTDDIYGKVIANEVHIKNSELACNSESISVHGGNLEKCSGEANLNVVEISDSSIKGSIYGGYVSGNGNANSNKVEISNGTETGNVYGGYVGNDGDASKNTIEISNGSTVTGDVYGGFVTKDGDAKGNTIILGGGSKISGSVYGGGGESGIGGRYDYNKLVISGAGNTIGGSKIKNLPYIVFDASNVANGNSMLNLTDNNCSWNSETVDVINPSLAVGEKITLISITDNTFDGLGDFKVNGKLVTNYNDGTTNYLVNLATENTEKFVHIDKYTIAKEFGKVEFCRDSEFIAGLFNGFDNTDEKQTLGQAEMTLSSVPQNITKIYGAFSEDNGVIAGGATINLETTDFSEVDFIGCCNTADSSKVGANNLNINVSGVVVKSVKDFTNLNFKLASDEKAMLNISDSFDLNGVSINSILPEDGFVGTQTLLKGNLANAASAKFRINDAEVGTTNSLTITTRNQGSIVCCNYTYGISGESITLSSGKSFISGVCITSGTRTAADDNTLQVTSEMAGKYTELYGVYNTDGGAATGATVNLSEAIDKENLTIYGGYSTGSGVDLTTGNILEVAESGNKIKNILNFEKINFSTDSVGDPMLTLSADTVDLSKTSINVNIANALAEGQTITLLEANKLELTDSAFTINNKVLDSNLSVKIADNSSKKYVNVAAYSMKNGDGKLTVTADKSLLTSIYRNGKESLSVEKFELTNDYNKFKNIYASYSGDNSAAEGGKLLISEKINLSETTLVGGKSTGNGEVKNNTLEISSSGAGSKFNGIRNFSDINIKLDNALAEGQTITLLEANKLELSDSVFTINNKMLDSNLSLKFATYGGNNEYVNVGGYSMANDGSKLTVTADESILTSKYTNGNESLSVEKFVLTDELNKFKAIYGSYSADNSAAEGGKLFINEAVNLSETTLIGGKSAGNGEVKNNSLEISSAAAGSKVKGAEKFDNFKFTLAAGMSGSTPMLSTTDKILLDGATIDTDLSNLDAADDAKLVLLDNTEGKAAKRLLNGKEGNIINAKKNEGFVAISSVGYSADEDKLAIDVKSEGAAGSFINEKGELVGNNDKKLVLGSSAASNMRAGFSRASEAPDMSGYKDIYGIYSAGSANPTGATIEIVSAIDYSNSVLHGGYKVAERAFYADGNTLRVKSLNSKVKGITDFETMEFDLPAETKSGDTMLKVTDEVDMAPTKSVGVEASKATGLKAGDSVNLIDSDAGIKNFGTQKVTVSGLTDKTGEVKVEDKALVLDINDEKPNKNTKAPVEAVSATMALVNQASALASSKLNKSMTAAVASANGGSATFASMNGGHSKYETGSYVEADSWNIGFGLAKKGMSKKNPDTTYGLFFQYGKSSFDTHNDGGFRGDGDSSMFGAGFMFHQEARSKYYYHGNIYAGKVDAKWNCAEGGYDDKATYYGMTFGIGRKHSAGGNKTMDIYGRYSFNHVGSMNGDLNGLKYDFDSTSSHNLRLGLRMEYAKKNSATAYWGLAWEHEFAGDSTATVATLGRTESPTLKGDSGIAEVGYQWKRGNWDYNINAEGSFGKRKGVTGSFNINYNF